MSEKLLLDGDSMWLKQSKHLWLLDPGHGGLRKNGTYTTAPAKQFQHPGFMAMEGVINRAICNLVKKALISKRIDYAVVADEVEDTSLDQRVRTADTIYAKDKRAVYLSIHSNASPEHNGAGWEIFTYFQGPGETRSKKIAQVFEQFYRTMGKGFKFRGLKEANFHVLRKTDCPAILVENLFFDNLTEAQYLTSAAGQQAIANIIVSSIEDCEALNPI